MIYCAGKGRMKDNCMFYHNGIYYLFSMYTKDNVLFNNIWLATSEDGVHFRDYGCVVEDFPKQIWAMKVYRGNDGFYMNSGSFTDNGKQVVLKFWYSHNLTDWEYMPELDVISPGWDKEGIRLDCMCVVSREGTYHGYATGQYGYLTSEDGAHWKAQQVNIDYQPFPPYNTALGGFEIADFIWMDGMYYLLCGGFGHLGSDGYGVYVFESKRPDGPFAPSLPFYRINGTSKRWVNMWERCFEKDGALLAHNYMYDGYSYECGNVYLPPIKKLEKNRHGLRLVWWEENEALRGDLYAGTEQLRAQSQAWDVFTQVSDCVTSPGTALPADGGAMIEAMMTLDETGFTQYSCGGLYLEEKDNEGMAILFDTYGKCEIAWVQNNRIKAVEDTIRFPSAASYYLEGGKTYSIKVITKNGMFEVYVDDVYLQTFNSAHCPDSVSVPFRSCGAISLRKGCTISDLRIYQLNL